MEKLKVLLITILIAVVLSSCGDDRKVAGSVDTVNPPAVENPQPQNEDKPQKEDEGKETKEETIDKANENLEPSKTGGPGVVTNPMDLRVVVNKKRSLQVNWQPGDLVKIRVPYRGRVEANQIRKEVADVLDKMFADAKKDGLQLYAVSGFRSYELQKVVYAKYVSQLGEKEAKKSSAYPGQSEHQTGLAVDISTASLNFNVTKAFENTPEGKWLKKHAVEYGFIFRYLQGKEEITGYKYEPWHIRYVGVDMAKEITDKNITLEEYMGY